MKAEPSARRASTIWRKWLIKARIDLRDTPRKVGAGNCAEKIKALSRHQKHHVDRVKDGTDKNDAMLKILVQIKRIKIIKNRLKSRRKNMYIAWKNTMTRQKSVDRRYEKQSIFATFVRHV